MRANHIGGRALGRAAAIVLTMAVLACLAGCGNRDRGPATADAKSPAAKAADAAPTHTEGTPATPPAAVPPAATIAAAAPVDAAANAAAPSQSKARLSHASASVDELMTKVLEAIASADVAALEALRITEDEHREVIWPADPGRAAGAPLDLAWDMLNRRSQSGARKAIEEFGGRTLNFSGLEFTSGNEHRGNHVLHRGTVLHARDSSRGESLELRFLGSVVDHDGQWKLVSFRD
jgi:hypothetical protein